MLVGFNASVTYSRLYGITYEVDVELTDEEYERLKESSKNHVRMAEDETVSDIYAKAYRVALGLDTQMLRDDPKSLAEKMAWYCGITVAEAAHRQYSDEEIASMLEKEGQRSIGYPPEFEEEQWY